VFLKNALKSDYCNLRFTNETFLDFCNCIILPIFPNCSHRHDEASGDTDARHIFEEIARRTGGVCVEFSSADAAPQELKDILSAVVVLTSGGIKLLEQNKASLPGAIKLLPYLK